MQAVLRTTNVSTVNPLKASVRCASRVCSTIWKPRRRKILTGGGPAFYSLAPLHVNSLTAVKVLGGEGPSTSLATMDHLSPFLASETDHMPSDCKPK